MRSDDKIMFRTLKEGHTSDLGPIGRKDHPRGHTGGSDRWAVWPTGPTHRLGPAGRGPPVWPTGSTRRLGQGPLLGPAGRGPPVWPVGWARRPPTFSGGCPQAGRGPPVVPTGLGGKHPISSQLSPFFGDSNGAFSNPFFTPSRSYRMVLT